MQSELFGIKENPRCAECMDSGVVTAGYSQCQNGDVVELRDVCECVIKFTPTQKVDIGKTPRRSWHERLERD